MVGRAGAGVMCAAWLWAGGALGQALPHLDVEKTCRTAERRQGPGIVSFDACMADEAAARAELSGLWASAKAATRGSCLHGQSIGGFASYIDLLSCVQAAEGVVLRPNNPR